MFLAYFTHSLMEERSDYMGVMKNQAMDICYFKRNGYTLEQISKIFGLSVEEVKETVSRPKRSSSNKRNKKVD